MRRALARVSVARSTSREMVAIYAAFHYGAAYRDWRCGDEVYEVFYEVRAREGLRLVFYAS